MAVLPGGKKYLQDLLDVNVTPSSGVDGYSLTYDDASGKFVLTNVTAGATSWGSITGTLSNQTDLNSALSGKADVSHNHDSDYLQIANDLSDLNDAATARTNLGLGSAAQDDTGDFATAAQGSLADSSIQPGDAATGLNVSATDKLLGRVSASGGAVEEIDCSDYSQSLLNLADAAAGRTALGLGTAATQASSAFDAAGTGATEAASAVSSHESTYNHGSYDSHLSNTSNPHSVTRAQVGAPAKTHVLSVDPDAYYDVNDGVVAGDFALNTVSGSVFICSDATATAAVWTAIGGGGGAMQATVIEFEPDNYPSLNNSGETSTEGGDTYYHADLKTANVDLISGQKYRVVFRGWRRASGGNSLHNHTRFKFTKAGGTSAFSKSIGFDLNIAYGYVFHVEHVMEFTPDDTGTWVLTWQITGTASHTSFSLGALSQGLGASFEIVAVEDLP